MSPLTNEVARLPFFPRPDFHYGRPHPGARDHFLAVEPQVNLRLRFYEPLVEGPTILFFHGNGETAADYDSMVSAFQALPANLVGAEYRGYGPCDGEPSLLTFLQDANETLNTVKTLHQGQLASGPMVVMGRSLGSAPAIHLAATRPGDLHGLIVESGFSRMVPLLELMGLPRGTRVREEDGPNNSEKMGRVQVPTLILHAEQDDIIPIRDAKELFDACPHSVKTLITVPNAGHNDIQAVAGKSYFEAIQRFLQTLQQEE